MKKIICRFYVENGKKTRIFIMRALMVIGFCNLITILLVLGSTIGIALSNTSSSLVSDYLGIGIPGLIALGISSLWGIFILIVLGPDFCRDQLIKLVPWIGKPM